MNPTAVKKIADALTNQQTLTSIMNKSLQIDSGYSAFPTVDLAAAILDNPEAKKVVDWFVGGGADEESVASAIASLLIAARMSPAQPTNSAHKNSSLPPAKILRFNPKGKSVHDTSIEDRVYLAQQGFEPLDREQSDDEAARLAWAVKVAHWRTANSFKDQEEEVKAYKAATAAGVLPTPPKSMQLEAGRTDPPAA
jgi:hypothetical protein